MSHKKNLPSATKTLSDLSIDIGDRVAFSAEFLRSTGQYIGEVPFMRGTVIEEIANDANWRLLRIDWGYGNCTNVNVKNLIRKDRIGVER